MQVRFTLGRYPGLTNANESQLSSNHGRARPEALRPASHIRSSETPAPSAEGNVLPSSSNGRNVNDRFQNPLEVSEERRFQQSGQLNNCREDEELLD